MRILECEPDKLIRAYVNKLKDLPFTRGVILFGSYAKERETPLSDIDICVLDDIGYPKEERRKVFELSTDLVELSLFSELPLPIKFEVIKGEPLWLKSKDEFRALRERITLEYLEMEYLWDEFLVIGKWLRS